MTAGQSAGDQLILGLVSATGLSQETIPGVTAGYRFFLLGQRLQDFFLPVFPARQILHFASAHHRQSKQSLQGCFFGPPPSGM